jgi:hypothetical protein
MDQPDEMRLGFGTSPTREIALIPIYRYRADTARCARQVRTVSTLKSGPSAMLKVARASESKPDVSLGGSGHEALR